MTGTHTKQASKPKKKQLVRHSERIKAQNAANNNNSQLFTFWMVEWIVRIVGMDRIGLNRNWIR